MYESIALFVIYPWLNLFPAVVLLISYLKTKTKTLLGVSFVWFGYYILSAIYDISWIRYRDVNPTSFDKGFVLFVFVNFILTYYAYVVAKTEFQSKKFISFSNEWFRLDSKRKGRR